MAPPSFCRLGRPREKVGNAPLIFFCEEPSAFTVAHSDRPVLNSPRYIINLTTEHQRRALRARAAVPVEHFLLALELAVNYSSPPSTQVSPTPGVPGRISGWCPAPF
ncbi:predicted protein [Coccidioides posadasii str. Silveira]|uniref:Predicted protein n=2 Tax=Coccidioides posadasii TaxID=199306 RepID=E9DB60_COCPS|nr:predicted protein [Coccidioides posadasii str. Silveira]KMM68008.1 hypothetical protein CPAG_04340 [Coccidioides posadasii RMSCC 3488]